jgi:peroxiredoxin
MSDGPPRSTRNLSVKTQPEVPVAKQSSQRMNAVRPFRIKIGDPAPQFDGLDEFLGKPLIVIFGPAADHGALAISLRDARADIEKKGANAVLVVAGGAGHLCTGITVVSDHDGAIHRLYDALDPDTGRPRLSTFLINVSGDITGVFVPGEPERALRLALDALDLAR